MDTYRFNRPTVMSHPSLDRTLKIAENAVIIGEKTHNNLVKQSETLNKTYSDINITDDNISHAGSFIRRIKCNEYKFRIIWIIGILLLLATLIGLSYGIYTKVNIH